MSSRFFLPGNLTFRKIFSRQCTVRLCLLKGAMQPQSQELFQVQWPHPQESCWSLHGRWKSFFDHQKLKGKNKPAKIMSGNDRKVL